MRAAFALARKGLAHDAPFPRGTTWEDMFPTPPPPELEEFYGPLFKYD